MPRRARPWFRTSRNVFCALIDGKQVPLQIPGPDTPEQRNKAEIAFLALLQQFKDQTGPKETKAQQTVSVDVDEFLRIKAKRVSSECFRQYKIALSRQFCSVFGSRRSSSLQVDEVEQWADRPEWASTTRHNRLAAVATFLKWAGHPLKLRKPPTESRSDEVVLTDEQFQAVLAAYDSSYGGDLHHLLSVLRFTGARPQEIAALTVAAVDWPNRCAKLKRHKTAGKGKQRIVYFNSSAVTILEAQRARYGSGFLFRTRAGNAYRGKMIVQQMGRLSKRAGFRAIAYGQRHSFATAALSEGVPDAVVAALLGHTSTAMIYKHYGHVGAQSRALREAVERVGKAS